MKSLTCLWLLWAGLLAASAQSAVGRSDRLFMAGHTYVRIEEWGRSEGFQARWIIPKEQIKLVAANATLTFWADSRKMSFNGVNVWLAAPIIMTPGAAYIAQVDLSSAIFPLLHPSRNLAGKSVRTICLDPGHGGKDPGNIEGVQQEKRYTLLLAMELSAQLRKAGYRVYLTRTSDRFVDFPDRTAVARQRGADLFVSLHFNSADGPGGSAVKGCEVYCLTPARTSSTNARGQGADSGAYTGNRFDSKNVMLAYRLQRALLGRLGTEDRGVRRARFAVLRDTTMPAVLIEGGFMSHRAEAQKLYGTAYRKQMAAAIVEGIQAYRKTVER